MTTYTYTDYINYINDKNNNNILTDPNYEDNMLCAVNVGETFDPDTLTFVKCKDFLNSTPYQLTIVRTTNIKDNNTYDLFAVMPKSYISKSVGIMGPDGAHSQAFALYILHQLPHSVIAEKWKNLTNDQKNDLSKKIWTEASNMYCKYQSDYNSCMNNEMDNQNPNIYNYDIKASTNISFIDKYFYIIIFIIIFIIILVILFLFYYIFKNFKK